MFTVKGTGLQSRGALVPFVSWKPGKEREDRGHYVLNKYLHLELLPLFNIWICKRDKKTHPIAALLKRKSGLWISA